MFYLYSIGFYKNRLYICIYLNSFLTLKFTCILYISISLKKFEFMIISAIDNIVWEKNIYIPQRKDILIYLLRTTRSVLSNSLSTFRNSMLS
jgi:hypothetical protein